MRRVWGLICVSLAVACVVLTVAFTAASSVDTPGQYLKASCACNLMQLGKAIQMYANDNGGYIFPFHGRPAYAASRQEPADNIQQLKAAYAPYLVDYSVWWCPADPYAHTHTLPPPDCKPPADQPDMKYDHFYTSYRHYARVRGEGMIGFGRLDAMLFEKDRLTTGLPDGAWIATPDMIMLMMDDGCYHGPPATSEYGALYGRNILFRDGHVKFETEETMRRLKK